MYKFLLFAVFLSALAAPAMAQDVGRSCDGDLIDEDGSRVGQVSGFCPDPEATITVTATGTRGSVAASGQAITVIGADEIAMVQGADLTRILERSPGAGFSRNGGTGSFTGLRLRGAEAEQVLAVLDGVRLTDVAAPSGGFDFGTLLALDLEKLEVLRSANSTIWGSDAIGGVVFASTRTASGLAASTEFGAHGTASAMLSGGLADEGRGFLGLSGTWYSTEGISAAADGSEVDGFEQWAMNGQARLYLGHTFELFARARLADGDLDIDGFPAPSYSLADTLETQQTRQVTGAAGGTFDNGPLFVTAAYSFADTTRDNFDDLGGESFTSQGQSDRLSLRGEYRPFGPLLVHFGAENEWTRYATMFDAGEATRILGAYAQGGVEWRGISAHLGARVDDHADFGSAVSLGADATYELVPGWRLRASAGEGFKAPSLFQLHSDFGNPLLQPERSTSVDIGLAYGERTMVRQPVYGALTFYQRATSDQIAFVSCFGVTTGICEDRPFGTYDNVARTRAQGLEAELWTRPAGGLSLGAHYTFTRSEDRGSGLSLARRPHHMATLTGDWQALEGLSLGADLRVVSASFDDGFEATRLGGYEVLTLRASYQASEQVEIFGRAENLWDEHYQTAAGYGNAGRGVFVGARLAW